MKPSIEVFPTLEALTAEAAETIVSAAAAAIRSHGRFTIALSGGSTPRSLYALLATAAYVARVDWPRIHVFWSDERCVPPADPASNYGMARATLLAHVPVPADNVHRIHGEALPESAALAYEDVLRRNLDDGFDLVLLGLGRDGHTASLFPHMAALHEAERWVLAQDIESAGMWRVTLTPVLINCSARVVFLVAGAEKAEILRRTLEGESDPDSLPARLIAPAHGELRWLVDRTAAARIAATRAMKFQ